MEAEEASYRKRKIPVVYIADDVPIKRDYASSWYSTSSPVVWNALVVSRTKWEGTGRRVTSRNNRLVRVRAMPAATVEAWELVLGELRAPEVLICDGAAAIATAAANVWGVATTVVPCTHHASENLRKHLTSANGVLPDKIRDHLFGLSRRRSRRTVQLRSPAGLTSSKSSPTPATSPPTWS